MSSEDCKKFLIQVAKDNNWPSDSKWKRRHKYKEGNAEMREFDNQYGNTVLIKEENNVLSLFNAKTMNIMASQIEKSELSIDIVLKNMTKCNTLQELLRILIIEKLEDSKLDVTFNKMLLGIVKNENDWSKVEEKVKDLHKEQFRNFYSMKSFIESLICQLVYHFEYEKENSKNNFYKDVSSKKVKVIYDLENVLSEFVETNGMSFIVLKMGGDWEHPVNAYLYYSTKYNKLKTFFPRDDGNTYNQITQTAYGSERESPKYRCLTYQEYDKLEEELGFADMMDKLEKDSSNYEENTFKEGVKQFKEHLLKKEI